jgi:hypothetical protein
MPRNVSFNLSYRVAMRRNSFNLPISRSILLRSGIRLPVQSPPFSPIDSIGNHRPNVPTCHGLPLWLTVKPLVRHRFLNLRKTCLGRIEHLLDLRCFMHLTRQHLYGHRRVLIHRSEHNLRRESTPTTTKTCSEADPFFSVPLPRTDELAHSWHLSGCV